MSKEQVYYAILGVGVLIIVVIIGRNLLSGSPASPTVSPEELRAALTDGEQAPAAQRILVNSNRHNVNGQATSGSKTSQSALKSAPSREVRAAACDMLGSMRDEESMPALFAAMEDPDPVVRGRAGAAVRKIMGCDYLWRANDPPKKRKQLLETMKVEWEDYLNYKRSQGGNH